MFHTIQMLEGPAFDVLKTEQRKHKVWKKIIKKLENSENNLRGRYHLINGLRYIKPSQLKDGESRLCIPPGPIRDDILKANHDLPIAGHLGVQRTVSKIRLRYYWPSMAENIKKYVNSCEKFQSRKASKQRPAGFMESIEATAPWGRVRMDILGPFPRSLKRNCHIIIAADYFTKWVETKAVPAATAVAVAEFFVENIVLRHGAPRALLTDQGKCFTNAMMKAVLRLLHTDYRTTTPYHPQANGLTERWNHTCAAMLSMYVERKHENWDETLPHITFAYNSAKQESTKPSPFELIYARNPLLPIDVTLGVI